MQTLDLGAEPHDRTGPTEVGLLWSLLFIPVLLLLGALSIPYAFVGSRIQRRRERLFCSEMETRGRVIEWSEFREAVEKAHGTLIVEWHSLKGPIRWWWTPDDIYSLCPHPIVEWTVKMRDDEGSRPLAEWCRRTYTSVDEGHALRVARRSRSHLLQSALLGSGSG